MAHDKKVTFTSTGNYGCGPKNEDDVYTVEEFIELCENHGFTDYDGSGHPVKDYHADYSISIWPSRLNLIPPDATHIVWYNK